MSNENTRICIPENIFLLSDEELCSVKKQLGLNMPVSLLREVGKCLNVEKILPETDILKFFDKLYIASEDILDASVISEFISEDKEPVRTLTDVYKKAGYLKICKAQPISPSQMMSVASRYFDTIGIHAPDSVLVDIDKDVPADSVYKDLNVTDAHGTLLLRLMLDDEEELPYGYEKAETSTIYKKNNIQRNTKKGLPLSSAIIILDSSPFSEFKEYEEKVSSLFADARFNELAISSRKIEERGIIYAVNSLTPGAIIDAEVLGSTYNEDEYFSRLVTELHGAYIVASKPKLESEFCSLAGEHGIRTIKIAYSLLQPDTVLVKGTKTLSIRSHFLHRIAQRRVDLSLKTSCEAFAPTCYEKVFINGFEATTPYTDNSSHFISSRLCKKNSFVNGINAALDSVLSLLSLGVSTDKIGLNIKLTTSKEEISSAVSSFLGIYRVMMELCIPDKNSSVAYGDKSSLLCTAFAKKVNSPTINGKLSYENIGNELYLLTFKRMNDKETSPSMMPDFESVRIMCNTLKDAIRSGKARSVKYFNGSLKKALEEMCENGIGIDSPYSEDIDATYVQGFIVATSPTEKLNASLLGSVIKEGQNENAISAILQ